MILLAHMEINISIDKEFKKYIQSIWLRKIVKIVIAAENVGTTRLEMSLVITGDEQIHQLNLKYLEEDRPTDVLSFPMNEYPQKLFTPGVDDVIHLGDVIISYSTAVRQAQEHNHSVNQEIIILLIHGILHLFGYDHDIPARKQVMNARETVILKTIEE